MPKKKIKEIIPDEMLPASEGPKRKLLLKLYLMNVEEARNTFKQEDALLSHDAILWLAAQRLKDLYVKHREGDKRAVLDALSMCLINDFGIPQWCLQAFYAALSAVAAYRVKSWDDVFGKPHPKNIQLGKEQWNLEHGYLVYSEVQARSKKGQAIDCHMFEEVAEIFNIGAKTAERLYYEVVAIPQNFAKL
jgi:hypothetical protein